jgi:caa(3)-type oxidase subunit IV
MVHAATVNSHHEHTGGEDHGPHHGPGHYVRIWALLMVLLIISILGPMLGHPILTLITAFGIAVVKAIIVAAYFMHLSIEKRYIWYMLTAMLLMVALFFAGVASDIHRLNGRNWQNIGRMKYIERSLEEIKAMGDGGHH